MVKKGLKLINKGYVDHDKVFDGLDQFEDGMLVLWRGYMFKLVSHKRSDGKRALGLEEQFKFVQPKRNEGCICGSEKKYKKCCWKLFN